MTGATDNAVERPSVLLVEDDRLTRTVLRHDLKLCGFDVDIAENGYVALKKLQRPCRHGAHGYDLVLTDVFMPKVDGEALIKAILNSDFRNIPVAVMSANCDDEAVERLLSIGAADYLIKPVRTSTLTRLKGLTSRCKQLVKPGKPIIPDSRHSTLGISLLQAAQLLSSDNPPNNCSSALAQQLPPSPPSSTPSPSPQETSFAPGATYGATHSSCRRVSIEVLADVNASADQSNTGSKKIQSMPLVKVATTATTTSLTDALCKTESRTVSPVVFQCLTFLAESGICAPLESRKAALARFRAKKARSHFAPKVRYHERKKLAEARPRYKGQFIKISTLPKKMQTGSVPDVDTCIIADAQAISGDHGDASTGVK